MIDLTPLEVRKKKGDFRKSMRGYDAQSVDDFLDLVADRLEQLVRENASLNERVSNTETQIADYRDRERALTEALVTAQEMRAEMRRQIEREVELKRREAEADADSIRADAAQMREREEENVRRLRARQTQFVQSYRAFLERELAEIGVMAETLDLSKTAETPRKRSKRKPELEREQEVELEREPERVLEPEPRREAQRKREPEPVAEPEPDLELLSELESEPFVPFDPDAYEPEPAQSTLALDPFEQPEPFEREPVEPELPELPELPDEELIDLSKHLPADADEDVMELELIDEVEVDDKKNKDEGEDPDGWVSTLLEGKGD